MDKCGILSAALLLLFAVYVTGQYYIEEERTLLDNKCKCIRVTSKFVPSTENPDEMILERNIEITIPSGSRKNISDLYSPLRTHFVYNLHDLCQKCDPLPLELNGQPVLVSQASCSKSDDECYTYDRNKCYTTDVNFRYKDQIITKKVPLNPESCYE
ncbi:PREDICTED: immunoglobulin J chain [Nanorana parkeri]|uniref:immunoglobulin J chain n=1 Tax=Nanorana parkeri TaxID=125878 RepID=UPI000854B9A4|nr:PREDICTED: immunoglobulin J chain [Nanorana parkeri]